MFVPLYALLDTSTPSDAEDSVEKQLPRILKIYADAGRTKEITFDFTEVIQSPDFIPDFERALK